MPRPDIERDATRLVETLESGGIAIMPGDVGYGILASTPDALRTSFKAKGRASHKRHAMIGDRDLHRAVHDVDDETQSIIDTITVDYDLPLGVVARFRRDHPVVARLDDQTLHESTVGETLAILVNNGPFQDACARISRERSVPLMGSSANVTGTGPKFRIDDIQPSIRQAADVEFDYGTRKYHLYRRSSTMIDFTTMTVIRIGSCYDLISQALQDRFGITLPSDPGYDALPSGHLRQELA
ncbi:Sua5/YciO/YrdC/YwlC family protein [Pseudonocardia alni]|uniref:Sua5/YciO/YrdC/YwlC family protein n=1 Tax=Pseudonocardia alni TaxID=33907 RepID=UPI00280C158F|nr:Sua5/YciO/YrdC/YwlC family protein [Pseudonocardia alni]